MTVGFAFGFDTFVALKPVDGDQEYVTPDTEDTPKANPLVFCVHVIVPSKPALDTGKVKSTVTTTWSVAIQPFVGLVAVKV